MQSAIGFANHGQKARSLAYNWTIDVALTDGRGLNCTKRKRLAVQSDSDTTAESEAHQEKPAPKKKKADGGKSLQPNMPKKKKNAKANVPPQLQAKQKNEGPNQDPKEGESPNEASDHGTPHANEPVALEKATSAAEV